MSSQLRLSSRLHLAQSANGALQAQPIRVLVADGEALIAPGTRELLDDELDMEVIAHADDLASVTRLVHAGNPDVLVLEGRLADRSCIELIWQLRESASATQIVLVTADTGPQYAQRALTAGASGCVPGQLASGELAKAIRAAARGEQYLSAPLAARLEELHRSLTQGALTPREVEVLRLIALGHTSVEIARQLHLSPRTVETHRAHIHKKLDLTTRSQLVRYALRRRLLQS
ncbi:MAG TPA: response regulator transcription factor [Solirubrobacteraceae bacterium]